MAVAFVVEDSLLHSLRELLIEVLFVRVVDMLEDSVATRG